MNTLEILISILPIGNANAISANEVLRQMELKGCKISNRTLRLTVDAARRTSTAAICTSTGTANGKKAGYYIASNKIELAQCCAMLRKFASSFNDAAVGLSQIEI